MAFIKIEDMWTMDPADVLTPKSSFSWGEPFGVTMIVQCSADLVQERVRADVQFQLVNPRQDAHRLVWFTTTGPGAPEVQPTIDILYENVFLTLTHFAWFISWSSYAKAMQNVGAAQHPGAFAVRGHVQVQGTDLFDLTEPFAHKYQLRR